MLYKLKLDVEELNKNNLGLKYTTEGNDIVCDIDKNHKKWEKLEGLDDTFFYAIREIEPGIYLTSDYGFDNHMEDFSDMEIYGKYRSLSKDGIPIEDTILSWDESCRAPYGVCDSVAQIKDVYKSLIDSDKPIVISLREVRKCDQPDKDGWRWHKWGKYIGTQERTTEYLADEPNIESVYIYHVHALRPKLEKSIEQEPVAQSKKKM